MPVTFALKHINNSSVRASQAAASTRRQGNNCKNYDDPTPLLRKPMTPMIQTRLYIKKIPKSTFRAEEYEVEIQKSINGCKGNKVSIPANELII